MLGIAVFRIRLYLAGKSVCALDHGHECSQSLSAAPCVATPETCAAPPIECTVVAIDLVHFGAQPSIRKRARSGRLLTGRTVQRSVKFFCPRRRNTGRLCTVGPLWTDAVAFFEHGGFWLADRLWPRGAWICFPHAVVLYQVCFWQHRAFLCSRTGRQPEGSF